MPKTKNIAKSAESPTLVNAAWSNAFAVADEAREELHKQLAALIEFASGMAVSGTKLARSLNDRFAGLAKQALVASDDAGRSLVSGTQKSARDAADRATATVDALVRPAAA